MRFLIAATSVLTLFLMSVGAISVAGAENVVGQKIHVRDAAAENAVGQKIHARDANSDTPLCEQYEIECDMAEENYMQSGCMDPKPPNPSTCSDLEESLDSCQTFLGTNCQEKANHVAAAKTLLNRRFTRVTQNAQKRRHTEDPRA
ncbi:uncharacterized protein IWZ02DRAFT_8719 [Phyllosticta citriasiana]|uniref:uncharacterized protein n=1 Tax=Phyllosticta citriasiana TaxID=595635 RepID=UPI0030FD470F